MTTDPGLPDTLPPLPRRVFLATLLSALAAGGAVGLGVLGWVTMPEAQEFRFSRGVTLAQGEDARLRGYLSQALEDERLHISIIGHSGTQGEPDANLTLSTERATTVATLATDMGIPGDRITATGVGGGSPFPRPDGMAERAYQSALARVTVSLQVRR